MYKFCLILTTIIVFISFVHTQNWFLQNLDTKCMKCLCNAATACNLTIRCPGGYCGPYKISKIYWTEAGNITLVNDEPQRIGAYQDCANDYWCAQKIVKEYLRTFGRDCNKDGKTDCYDYMMINFNGGFGCEQPLERDEWGRGWLNRYNQCMAQKT